MEDDHTEESSDGTLARGDDHSNYTHKQDYVEVIYADVTWRVIILRSRQMVLYFKNGWQLHVCWYKKVVSCFRLAAQDDRYFVSPAASSATENVGDNHQTSQDIKIQSCSHPSSTHCRDDHRAIVRKPSLTLPVNFSPIYPPTRPTTE
jgi:hypothetical protein